MAKKRLLYLTALRLQAYSWSAGTLVADGSFDADDQGVSQFAHYLGTAPKALYYVVADVLEEDFFQENIPLVRGKDRRTLLGRKLAQRYRDISLAVALSLGTQEGERREERILFSSFTNTQQFQPWLTALRANEAKLVGIYSLALIAPLVAKRLKLISSRCILVSLQDAGMRQSYVENGKIRFSRLGRADPSDPQAAAEACAAESNRILQYLINLRILPREAGAVDVVALAPEAHRGAYQAAWGDNPRLKLKVIALESACQTVGLKSAPPGMLGERLFLHVLARVQPAEQFGGNSLRRFYRLWRARLALLAGGAAICAASLLFSGLQLVAASRTSSETEQFRQQEAGVTGEYDRLQANYPKTPLPREVLKSALGTAGGILRQSVYPDRIFADISQALSAVPQIELEKLDWSISNNPRARAGGDASKAEAVPGRPADTTPPANVGRGFEVVEISAHLNAVKGSDYRGIKSLVEQFLAALGKHPGIVVVSSRTPVDAIAEKAFSGDVSEREPDSVPKISVTIARELGT